MSIVPNPGAVDAALGRFAEASIYIHIPFCTVLCPFCDFYKTDWARADEARFVDACIQEIKSYEREKKILVPTVFFGGGTPSVLSDSSFRQISEALQKSFDVSDSVEMSVEANPEDITDDFLDTLKSCSVTRLSLGVQSLHDRDLTHLGRGHTAKQSIEALEKVSQTTLRLSVDLIYGMQTATIASIKENCDQLFEYQPEQFSIYSLTIEPGTLFHKQNIDTVKSEEDYAQYSFLRDYLAKHGYEQYEVSAFAKPGSECRHNKRYWQFQNYIGLGPSAQSLVFPYRFHNAAQLKNYGPDSRVYEDLSQLELMKENIIANFRTPQGLDYAEYQKRYKIAIADQFSDQLKEGLDRGWLRETERGVSTTEKGLYVLDEVCELFM